MPPVVALIICTVFVLYLLWLEHKQAPEVSLVSWIPTIFVLLMASKPLSVWFGMGTSDLESGSPLDRNVLIALFILGIIILVKRGFKWSEAIRENIWLILVIGYMLISILWSDIPFVSFRRWVRQLTFIMAFLLLTEPEPRQAMQSIFRRTIYIFIPFSYILVHYFPHYGRAYGRWSGMEMWVGVSQQKNGLGRICMIAAFYLIWTLIRRWQGSINSSVKGEARAEIFVLIITFYLLFVQGPGAKSVSGITSLIIGLLAYGFFILMKKWKMQAGPGIMMTIIAAIIIFGTYSLFHSASLGSIGAFTSSLQNTERDETLTYRTVIWADLLPIAMSRPILGHGCGGYDTFQSRFIYGHSDSHSGYLEVLLEYGFVGLLVFSIYLLFLTRKAQKVMAYDYDWGVLCFCYLLMTVIHNMVEVSLNDLSTHLMITLIFIGVTFTAISSKVEKG